MFGKRRADKCHIFRPADFEKAFEGLTSAYTTKIEIV